jgi:hypothetical protein
MNRLLLTTCLAVCLFSATLSAQFSGGFRAGLNFNSFSGDQEMSGGVTYEDFARNTGFHVGATFAYAFTDLVGVKADLMYSQKGGGILFNGPSYFFLYDNAGTSSTRITGDLTSERDVVNSFIDIPVMGYYRIGPIELEGGVSAGFLVNSRASGGATFTNNFINGSQTRFPDDLIFNYDYNYFRDGVGRASIVDVSRVPLSTGVNPPAVIGAYYNSVDDTPVYRRFDFGLVVGASFFLNNGLYLSARYQYGLTDMTRPENDRRIATQPGDPEVEFNTGDKDYHRSIQASVGFRF